MFFLGLFIGGTLGMFLASVLMVGKASEHQSEIDRLKFRLYGKSNKAVDESGNNDDKSVG